MITSLSLPIIPISLVTSLVFIEQQSHKLNDFDKLQYFEQNSEELKSYIINDYDVIANKLENDVIVNSWINHLDDSYLSNSEKGIAEISDLDLLLQEKAFLLQNYLEKINIYQSTIAWESKMEDQEREKEEILKSNANLRFSYSQINPNYLYVKYYDQNTKLTEYYNVTDSRGNKIPLHGSDYTYTRYHAVKTDITKFYWSNQTVLNIAYEGYQNDISEFVKQFDNTLKNKLNSRFGSYAYDRLQYLLSLENSSADLNINDQNILYFYYKNYLSALREAIGEGNKYFFSGTGKYLKPGNIGLSFLANLAKGIFENGVPDNLDDLAQLTIDTALHAAYEIGFTALGSIIGGIVGGLTIGNPALGVALGGIFGYAFGLALGMQKTGNGFTIWENYNDYGLNDWNYQWSNNFQNMIGNGINWSEKYQKGIVWEVQDGWFFTPRLNIVTQGESNWTSLSGTNISSNDFNWGHKIKLHKK